MIDDKTLMRKLMLFMKTARMKMGGHGMPGMGPHGGFPPFGPGCGRMPGRSPEGCDRNRPPFHPPFGPHGKRPPLSREHLLIIIGKHPEGIRQKTIAETVGINQSSASELINKLEDDGYIERKVDPADKRATLLFLTEKGTARAAEVEDERQDMFRGVFEKLTEEEKQTLSDLLDKLLDQEAKEV